MKLICKKCSNTITRAIGGVVRFIYVRLMLCTVIPITFLNCIKDMFMVVFYIQRYSK
jgi:hypothetical protein